MSGLSLYQRAFLPDGSLDALPDELTIAQLAQLRGWSVDGADREVIERVRVRIENLIGTGRLATVTRIEQEWDHAKYRSPTGGISTFPMGGVPASAVKVMRDKSVVYVQRAAAVALREIDPDDWGDGAIRWLGVPPVAVAAIAGDALPPAKDSFYMQKREVIKLLEPHFGSIKSILDNAATLANAWVTPARNPAGRGWDVDVLVGLLVEKGKAKPDAISKIRADRANAVTSISQAWGSRA